MFTWYTSNVHCVKTGWVTDQQFYAWVKAPCRFFRWKDTADPVEGSAGAELSRDRVLSMGITVKTGGIGRETALLTACVSLSAIFSTTSCKRDRKTEGGIVRKLVDKCFVGSSMQREPLAKRSSLQRYCFSIAQGKGRAQRNKQRKLGKHVVDPAFKSLPLSDLLILHHFASGSHICRKSLQSSITPFAQSAEGRDSSNALWTESCTTTVTAATTKGHPHDGRVN